jgi:HlyD family secretion protein
MRTRTKLIIGGVALLVVGAVVVRAVMNARNAGVAVRVEAVETRDLEAVVIASGWIRPHRKVDVQSDIQGRITLLEVEEGQAVQRDQLLLRIDPEQYQAAVARAQAVKREAQSREAQARANLIQSERRVVRMRQMAAAAAVITEEELEQAETQYEVQKELMRGATFNVEQAQAALEEAEERLDKTVIRAPMDGVVTRLNVDEGETAIVGTMNNAGSLLLTIADLSIMEAVVRVDETDIPRISLGDSAALEIDAFPNQTFAGRVTEISHSSVRPPTSQTMTTQQAVDFEIVIQLHALPENLRSDLSASAEIVTESRKGAMSIPIIALTVRERAGVEPLEQEDPVARAAAVAAREPIQDVEGVFVVRAGKVTFVPVQVGIAGREHFEVISGLASGDSVVAGPYEAIRTLTDGATIRTMPAMATATEAVAGTRR